MLKRVTNAHICGNKKLVNTLSAIFNNNYWTYHCAESLGTMKDGPIDWKIVVFFWQLLTCSVSVHMPTIQQVKLANWISVQLNLRNGQVFQTFVNMQGNLIPTTPSVSKFGPPLEKGALNPLHALLRGAPQPDMKSVTTPNPQSTAYFTRRKLQFNFSRIHTQAKGHYSPLG